MINCENCPAHCCGRQKIPPPYLLPQEVKEFGDNVEFIQGQGRLKKQSNGTCVYLDENQRCTIYSKRPLECKLYPWIYHRENGVLTLKLHEGCPRRKNADPPEIPDILKSIPDDYWDVYFSIPWSLL